MEQNKVRFLLAEKNKAKRGRKGGEVLPKRFGYSIDSFYLFFGISVAGFLQIKIGVLVFLFLVFLLA